MHTLRKLEIFDLCGIGESDTANLSKWLSNVFYNMYAYKHNNLLCYKNKDGETLIVYNHKKNSVDIGYNYLWSSLIIEYTFTTTDIKIIVAYAIRKYFNIKCNNVNFSQNMSIYDLF